MCRHIVFTGSNLPQYLQGCFSLLADGRLKLLPRDRGEHLGHCSTGTERESSPGACDIYSYASTRKIVPVRLHGDVRRHGDGRCHGDLWIDPAQCSGGLRS